MPSSLHRFNRHGARLCDAVGCRRHKRLVACFRGRFCRRHADELARIRAWLALERGAGAAEIAPRQAEALYRKQMCPGHMRWLLGLEARFNEA